MTVQEEAAEKTFAELDLDGRLVDVLSRNEITKPTLIQEKAIPLALLGKDILARAKTGSGKTFAYLLPILHGLLRDLPVSGTMAMIIVPTKELANQLEENLNLLSDAFAPVKLTFANLAAEDSVDGQRKMLEAKPNIIVSTPSRVSNNSDHIAWLCIKYFVLDEADYILSFGYSEDLDKIIPLLPKVKQSFLMSATISEDIEKLKSFILRNAVILKLEMGDDEEDGEAKRLEQFTIQVSEDADKFLLAFAIFKLNLLKGKMIIFMDTTERAYKLRIFLEEFGVRSCCVNPDFPLSCRQHIVEEFNKGVYDILIAPDGHLIGMEKESGVARGVDFKRVDVVINFDFPETVESYVHRVGRTARGGLSGTAVSFIDPAKDLDVLERVRDYQEARNRPVNEYAFDMAQLDGFRYRMSDALRAVTKAIIKETQLNELKAEMANSAKIKAMAPNRSEELSRVLRHDRKTAVRQQPHLKHLPEYLMSSTTGGSLPQTTPNPSRRMLKKHKKVDERVHKGKKNGKKGKKPKKVDPLKKRK